MKHTYQWNRVGCLG